MSETAETARSSAAASPWSPLHNKLFRGLWIATIVSNVGTWMQDVGAGWLMTSLTASPALVALVDHCATAAGELSAAGVLQYFAGSPHEAILASVLAKAEDHALTLEMTEANVRKGLENWWQQARRSGTAAPAPAAGGQTAEEIQRLRQLDYVRQTALGQGTNPSEDTF